MNKQEKDKLTKFFDALFIDEEMDVSEIRKELESSGIDLSGIESAVKDLLMRERRSQNLSWLTEAQRMRSKINEAYENLSQKIKSRYKDARELVEAIRTGKLGFPLQEKASAFFRNQDFKKMSDADLVSFLEDCEVLDSLSNLMEKEDK